MTRPQRNVAVAAALFLVAFLLWWQGRPSAIQRATAVGEPRPVPAGRVASPPVLAEEVAERLGEVVVTRAEQMREAVEEMKLLQRFPVDSRPLTKDMIDILDPDIFWPVTVPIADAAYLREGARTPRDQAGQAELEARMLHYRFEVDRSRYHEDQPVELSLFIYRGEKERKPVQAAMRGPLRITTLDVNGTVRPVGELVMQPRAPAPDQPAFVATWTAPATLAGYDGYVNFRATWAVPGGTPVTSDVAIHYTGTAPGRVMGTFEDRLENGSLVIDVAVDIARPGRYQLDGRLFAADGKTPVAFSNVQAELTRGRQMVSLRFYGLIFREAAIAGPYVLAGVTGNLISYASSGRGPELAPSWRRYTTDAHSLAQLTDQEWTSPEKEERLRVYEKVIADMEAAERAKGDL